VGLADAVQHPDRRLVIGYALLGATWLVMKTEGELRDKAYRLSWGCCSRCWARSARSASPRPFLHAVYPALVRLAEHHPDRAGADRGRRRHRLLLLRSLANKYDYQPFFLSLALFALSYAGLGISMYPYIVPQSITIWQAARPRTARSSCWSASRC
jgi:cytochrome d ubiquinol oxidase subunit II